MSPISIRTLMAVIIVLAVGLAALRNADETWAGIVFSLTLGLISVSPLFVAYGRGRERAWWLGFLICGSVYLTLVFGPWCEERIGPRLATSQALEFVHSKVVRSASTLVVGSNVPYWQVLASLRNANADGFDQFAVSQILDGATPPTLLFSSPVSPNYWKALMPGAANREAFLSVGHGLFAMLWGLFGAFLAVRLYARREPGESGPTQPSTG